MAAGFLWGVTSSTNAERGSWTWLPGPGELLYCGAVPPLHFKIQIYVYTIGEASVWNRYSNNKDYFLQNKKKEFS